MRRRLPRLYAFSPVLKKIQIIGCTKSFPEEKFWLNAFWTKKFWISIMDKIHDSKRYSPIDPGKSQGIFLNPAFRIRKCNQTSDYYQRGYHYQSISPFFKQQTVVETVFPVLFKKIRRIFDGGKIPKNH